MRRIGFTSFDNPTPEPLTVPEILAAMSKGQGLFPYVMGQKLSKGQEMKHLFIINDDGVIEFLPKERSKIKVTN